MYAQQEKTAADLQASYDSAGSLYLKTGTNGSWLMLQVPNAVVNGVFATINEPGVELPLTSKGSLEAHITVMSPEELETIGGAQKITERGKTFRYRIGGLYSVEPEGWKEVSRCWLLKVHSPALQKLRMSYGLTALPRGGHFDFHITVAIRKVNVLGRNSVAKGTLQGVVPH